jgi:metal-responsive CopG/Arc/MetJ family transcriptional regulator
MVRETRLHGYPNVVVRLDPDDKALLNAVIRAEKLNRSDVMRRALRAYAKQLGVEQPTKAA